MNVQPLFNYPGSKLRHAKHLSSLVPDSFDNYIEPFAGGAAMFFALAPKRALLNDLFAPLILAYEVARTIDVDEFVSAVEAVVVLTQDECTTRVFRKLPTTPLEFLTLAYCVYNLGTPAIWDTNKGAGYMPSTMRHRPTKTEGVTKVGRRAPGALGALRECDLTLTVGDFNEAVDMAKPNDFVFLDPPYFGNHKLPYQFGATQSSVFEALNRLDDVGAKFILTVGGLDLPNLPWRIEVLPHIRAHAATHKKPRLMTEYAIMNY